MGILGYAAIATVLALQRVCPRCGKKQVVPASRGRRTAVCKRCGEEIPPPPTYSPYEDA